MALFPPGGRPAASDITDPDGELFIWFPSRKGESASDKRKYVRIPSAKTGTIFQTVNAGTDPDISSEGGWVMPNGETEAEKAERIFDFTLISPQQIEAGSKVAKELYQNNLYNRT